MGVVLLIHLGMSGISRRVQAALSEELHLLCHSEIVVFLSIFFIFVLNRGGSPGVGSSDSLALILPLSAAMRSAGGMPARRNAAWSETVLYALMTLSAAFLCGLLRLDLNLALLFAEGDHTGAA